MFDLKTMDFCDLDFSATAGYYDPTDGQLYLQVGDDIVSFNGDTAYRSPKYTSKKYLFKSAAFGMIKAVAKSYPVTVDINYPDVPKPGQTTKDSVLISSKDPERLLDVGIVESCEVSVNQMDSELSLIALATVPEELPL